MKLLITPLLLVISVSTYPTREYEVTLEPEDFATVSAGPEQRFTGGDPTLKAHRFEGDMAGFDSKSIIEFVKENNDVGRNAIKNPYQRWPDGIVAYTISSVFDRRGRNQIAQAVEEFEKRTCIRFTPRKDESHYIHLRPIDGCYSYVGRVTVPGQSGRQDVSLGNGCVYKGIIMHELMHAIGFFHEQSRADRDQYVEIIADNIQTDALPQFQSYSLNEIQHLGTTYDYGSIMHYRDGAFAKYHGLMTIKAKDPSGQSKMGNRDDFSETDVVKINKLYECERIVDETSGEEAIDRGTTDCSDGSCQLVYHCWIFNFTLHERVRLC